MFRILGLLSAHGTVLAWGSEHVQNIMTTVCTWYKVIKSTVHTHYKLFITTVCTWFKVINSTFGTQSHPLDGSTFVIFDTFVTGEQNIYGYNTFYYCSGIC